MIGAVMLGIIVLLAGYGFSDLMGTSKSQIDVLQTKPWRPFARLAFSFVMISITCLLGGALIKSLYQRQ